MFGMLAVFTALSGCKNTPAEGETCSIKISTVEFTRSLNDAKSRAAFVAGKLVLKSNARSG